MCVKDNGKSRTQSGDEETTRRSSQLEPYRTMPLLLSEPRPVLQSLCFSRPPSHPPSFFSSSFSPPHHHLFPPPHTFYCERFPCSLQAVSINFFAFFFAVETACGRGEGRAFVKRL